MAASNDDGHYDIILLFGPPVPNKLKYLPPPTLAADHTTICLETVFQKNSSYGLRDVALLAVASLHENKQTILIDEFRLKSTRESLIKIIKSKVSSVRVLLVQILPSYGYLQTMWQWYSSYATGSTSILKDESAVKNWFDVNTGNIDLDTGYALFLQWDDTTFDNDDSLPHLTSLCSKWSSKYPTGRIIFICDESSKSKGYSLEYSRVRTFLKKLVSEVSTPVYANWLSSPGTFCIPPLPGIMAFLQQRHCLNLYSQGTCYLYVTQEHMLMAQATGVKHLKLTTLLESSNIYNTFKAQPTRSSIPKFLKRLTFLKNPDFPLAVPLFEYKDEMSSHVSKPFPQGIHEHIFIKDIPSLSSYQKELECQMNTTSDAHATNTTKVGLTSASEQKMPTWMKSKSPCMLKRKHNEECVPINFRSKTVYLLTEKELLEMAKEVLTEAEAS